MANFHAGDEKSVGNIISVFNEANHLKNTFEFQIEKEYTQRLITKTVLLTIKCANSNMSRNSTFNKCFKNGTAFRTRIQDFGI